MSKFAKSRSKSKSSDSENNSTRNEAQSVQASMRGHQNAAGNADAFMDGAVFVVRAGNDNPESEFEIIDKKDAPEITAAHVKQEVTVLLNVYTDKERRTRKVNFLKGAWRSFKSAFKSKKNMGSLTKEQVLTALVETFRTTDKLGEVANDPELMQRIAKEMPEAQRNAVLDKLYRYSNDPKILMAMIKARFGVTVVDSTAGSQDSLDDKTKGTMVGKPTLDWTAAGLVEVYKVYTNLPQSHLNLIKCLYHETNDEFGGAAIRTKKGTTGVYRVNYRPGNETEQVVIRFDASKNKYVGHCDNAADTRVGAIKMDMTTAHELGHIVDGTTGWKISGEGSPMRQVSQWRETKDEPMPVLAGMKASMAGEPFASQQLSPEEKAVVDKVALIYLKESGASFDGRWANAARYLSKTINEVVSAEHPRVNAAALKRKVIHLNAGDDDLFYHLWRGQGGNRSCYNYQDAMRGMNRPFWQGYAGRPWFTFDKNAWNNKISCYQFRCPAEEFAETYASYHAAPAMGKRKGEMTPQPLLNWFLGAQYGDIIPAEQSPVQVPGANGAGREQA